MAKSKKKRQQFKDFQKVKLKVGKKISKPDNVTNTFFRTKSINIREKLRADVNTPTTKRKLTITELLGQCEHYNGTVRQDAVSGIREMLFFHKEHIRENLASIVDRISSLFIDQNASVRSSTHRLMRSLFPQVSTKEISPFFNVITVYLCSAMTHIYEDIQNDSLEVLDLLLKFYPSLAISKSNQILFNFIEQISKKSSYNSKGVTASTSRSLHVNPNSRLSKQKWRIRVLERFQILLGTMFSWNERKEVTPILEMNDSKSSFQYVTTSHINEAFKLMAKPKSITEGYDDVNTILASLSPILFQCWLEAKPDNNSGNDNNLCSESINTLNSVLNIFTQMVKFVIYKSDEPEEALESIRKTLLSDFINYFLANFPYSLRQEIQWGKKANTAALVSSSRINYTVVQLFSYFMVHKGELVSSEWCTQLLDYVTQQLKSKNKSESQLLLSTVEHLLKMKLPKDAWSRLVSGLYENFRNRPPAKCKTQLRLLEVIVNKPFAITSDLQEWLTYFPKIMSAYENDDYLLSRVLNIIRMSCERGIYIPSKRCDLICLLEKDFFKGLNNYNQHKVVEIVFHMHKINLEVFRALAGLCHTNLINKTTFTYLVDSIHYRFINDSKIKERKKKAIVESDYISFLLSVITGKALVENSDDLMQFSLLSKELILTPNSNNFTRSVLEIKKSADNILCQFPSFEKIVIAIVPLIKKSFDCTRMDLTTSLALLDTIASYHNILNDSLPCKDNMHNMPSHKVCHVAEPISTFLFNISLFSVEQVTEKDADKWSLSEYARDIVVRVLSSCSCIFEEYISLCGLVICGSQSDSITVRTLNVINVLIFCEPFKDLVISNINTFRTINRFIKDAFGVTPLPVDTMQINEDRIDNNTIVFEYEINDKETTKCTICQEEYLSGEEIRRLKCFHIYHSLCIETWLDISISCPLCKLNILE